MHTNSPTPHPARTWTPRRAFSTLGCPDQTLREVFQLAQEYHIGAVELRCLEGRVITPANFPISGQSTGQLFELWAAAGVKVGMLGTSVKLFAPQADDLAALVDFARIADRFECPYLRIFDGGAADIPPTAEMWALATELVNAWEAQRRQLGLRAQLAVETHDATVRPETARELISKLPELNILWDAHHTWRHGSSLTSFYNLAREKIVHVHAKDSINSPSPSKPFTYCLPGDGEFPWTELGTLLGADRFSGLVSLEWERQWHPYLQPLAEALPGFIRLTQNWR